MKTILLLTLVSPLSLFACINTYEIDGHAELEKFIASMDLKETLLSQRPEEVLTLPIRPEVDQIRITKLLPDKDILIPLNMKEAFNYSAVLGDMETALATDYRVRTNQAVRKIRSGQTKSAIAILLSVEKEIPGLYQTATNLGTAYELEGNLVEARTWIDEGIKRNPEAHQGTEWVHLAIINAKLALKENPEWLEDNPVIKTESSDRPRAEIIHAIEYQLEERLYFVKAPDPTVSDLFNTLGKLYQSIDSTKAEENRKKAREFATGA